MTTNQIAYLKLQEEARANRARERENLRSNLRKEELEEHKQNFAITKWGTDNYHWTEEQKLKTSIESAKIASGIFKLLS